MSEGTWTISPCPHRLAGSLAQQLGLSEITASVLVRRGYGDPEQARAFLAGEQPLHDPFLLGDMNVAVDRIRAAVAAGTRICVHGDYDVDGICATVLAVLVLRELGADVDWHLPSRFDEGYGVSGGTLERLAEEGCGLVLTVDCGITAVDEVRRANELGVSEAELIRRAIDSLARTPARPRFDSEAWESVVASMEERARVPTTGERRTWRREDLYEDRLGRFGRLSR